MHDLSRTVLLTGASSGIGRAVARKLLQLGCRVYGVSRDGSRFTTKHPKFSPLTLDLADLDALPEQLKQLEKQLPDIDVLVFSAGFGQFGSLEQFSYGQIQALMNVNFTAQAFMARTFIPNLKKRPRADLVFIGSEAALKGSRKGAVYCASKFAVRGFAQALREECARSLVKVSLINPGMVKSEFFERLDFEPGDDPSNYIRPEEVAETVAYVLSTPPGIAVDEINMSPLNKVVKFK